MNKKTRKWATATALAFCLIAAPVHADDSAREDRAETAQNVVQLVIVVVLARWLWNQVAR